MSLILVMYCHTGDEKQMQSNKNTLWKLAKFDE